MRNLIVCLLCLLIYRITYSQELRFVLKGKVTDIQTKKPVFNAEIRLDASDGFGKEIYTDSSGIYSFDSTCIKMNTSYSVRAFGGMSNYLNAEESFKFTTTGYSAGTTFVHDFELRQRTICTMYFPTVPFQKESSALHKNQTDSLEFIYQLLRDNPTLVLQIRGYSSSDEKNAQKLSVDRAQNVLNYLTAKGLEKDRFEIKALGNKKSLTGYDSPDKPKGRTKEEQKEDRMANRLVTFSILRLDYDPKKKK